MADRAAELAGLLLRDGALRREDDEHRQIYAELMADAGLYDDVRARLAAVGFELVQELGHLGVRVAPEVVPTLPLRNRMGIHAGHVRLIVYLWVQLVYREWTNLRRGLETRAPGAEQGALFGADSADDEPPCIAYSRVYGEFAEHMPRTRILGYLRALQRWRFVRFDEKRDRIWADAGLYVLVERSRMEEFVVGLARRLGTDTPAEAVRAVAVGEDAAAPAGEEDDA
jgi:hypothetical protein